MNIIKEYRPIAQRFKILGHPARIAILLALRTGEQCVCNLEASLGLRQAYISQQFMLLREAGLVNYRQEGWNRYYFVTQPEIFQVLDAMFDLFGQSPEITIYQGVCKKAPWK